MPLTIEEERKNEKSEQTNKILALRNKGYGYKRIAKELDVSVGTVRYELTKVEDDTLSGLFKTCGKKMMSIKGKKKKCFVLISVDVNGETIKNQIK